MLKRLATITLLPLLRPRSLDRAIISTAEVALAESIYSINEVTDQEKKEEAEAISEISRMTSTKTNI